MPDRPGPLYLPGDPEPALDAMIRVDHAGEFGAVRIYEGQLAVLPPGPARDAVAEMVEQEQRHLETFDRLIAERRVRPTLLSPIWRVAGFALGAVTARMGPRSAMACTVAVEEVHAHLGRGRACLLADTLVANQASQEVELCISTRP